MMTPAFFTTVEDALDYIVDLHGDFVHIDVTTADASFRLTLNEDNKVELNPA